MKKVLVQFLIFSVNLIKNLFYQMIKKIAQSIPTFTDFSRALKSNKTTGFT